MIYEDLIKKCRKCVFLTKYSEVTLKYVNFSNIFSDRLVLKSNKKDNEIIILRHTIEITLYITF